MTNKCETISFFKAFVDLQRNEKKKKKKEQKEKMI